MVDEDIAAIAVEFDQDNNSPREAYEGQTNRIEDTWLEGEDFTYPSRDIYTRRCAALIDGENRIQIVYCTTPDRDWPVDQFRARFYRMRDDGECFTLEGYVSVSGTTGFAPKYRFVRYIY
jgi:hypothetical protein